MGAWSFIEPRLRELLPDKCSLSYHGRSESASPATGAFRLHQAEERSLIERALEGSAPVHRKPEVAPSDGSAGKRAIRATSNAADESDGSERNV